MKTKHTQTHTKDTNIPSNDQHKQNTQVQQKQLNQQASKHQLSMSDLYYKNQQKQGDAVIDNEYEDDREQVKDQVKQNNLQMGMDGESKLQSRKQLQSCVSFSRFQNISSQLSENQNNNQKKVDLNLSKNINIPDNRHQNRVPTSSKIISSKKIIEKPIQILHFNNEQFDIPKNASYSQSISVSIKNLRLSKHEYTFQFHYISEKDLFQRFSKLAKSKNMEVNNGDKCIIAIKKIPIYKSALSLCFPSSQYEHEIYELSIQGGNGYQKAGTGKFNQISGDDKKYYNFREQFLVQLWLDKLLIHGNLHENIRHFIRYINSPTFNQQICNINIVNQNKKNSSANQKKPGSLIGSNQLDQIKNYIDRTVKCYIQFLKVNKSNKNVNKSQQNNKKQTILQYLNTPQMIQLKNKIKQAQQNIKRYLQKQLKKQQQLKFKRSKANEPQNNQHQDDLIKQLNTKVFVTPSVQRMLLTILYHHLALDQIVKKYVVSAKDIGDFQKQKMIIKGSLNPADIFKYLQLQQFYKYYASQNSQLAVENNDKSCQKNNKISIFPQSTKILSSLNYSSHPSPYQILELISIFKNTLSKQIESLSNKNKVKLQDHANQERTFLQFCIYCVIMCENRDLLATIETGKIFCDVQDQKLKIYYMESLNMAGILRKAIQFVINQWQL